MSSKSNGSAASAAATANGSTNGPPKYEARLCHVVKRPDFDGYGFNLHAEKGRPGQYIGKVDDASPAESAGLRQGDRIIEVNGQNITTETHKKVVELIKAVPNETKLLVIDPRADANDLKLALAKATGSNNNNSNSSNNNNNNKTTISNGHPENGHGNGVAKQTANGQKKASHDDVRVEEKSPKSNGTTVNSNNNNNNNHSHMNGNGSTVPDGPAAMEKIIDDTKKVLTVTDGAAAGKMALNGQNGNATTATTTTTTEPNKAPTSAPTPAAAAPAATTEGGKKLNLTMTAAEMRAQLAARKKYDPKSEVCDLRKKYDIIQKM